MREDFLWTEKYRPKTVADTILPDRLKAVFQNFVEQGSIPNLLLCGDPGIGKTTIARAMVEQVGCDWLMINGSKEGRYIDTLHTTIQQFASSVSFSGNRKYVILDEADYLNPQSVQPALRNFIEEFSRNCGFIMTCNFKNKIIDPLHSRCSVVEFKITKDEKKQLAMAFFKRVCNILDMENVEYDKQAVASLIQNHFPDWRRVLNELQRYSAAGPIDTGILVDYTAVSLKQLMQDLKDKNFTKVRKWVGEHSDIDQTKFFRQLYDSADEYMTPVGVAQLVLIVAKYSYQAAFVADQEVNLAAALTEIMIAAEWK